MKDTEQPWADLMALIPPEMHNGVILESSRFTHPTLGTVKITVRSTARRMTARRKGSVVAVSVPPRVRVTDLMKFLHQVRTESPLPTDIPHYHDGYRIEAEGVTFIIARKPGKGAMVEAYPTLPVTTIEVGEKVDFARPEATRHINFIIKKLAVHYAPQILIPQAKLVASKVGATPAAWTISTGERTLGHCSGRGVIALSAMLIFYPPELREYVICHELAHLTEMNHSPRFHTLCNTYCNLLTSPLPLRILPLLRLTAPPPSAQPSAPSASPSPDPDKQIYGPK